MSTVLTMLLLLLWLFLFFVCWWSHIMVVIRCYKLFCRGVCRGVYFGFIYEAMYT